MAARRLSSYGAAEENYLTYIKICQIRNNLVPGHPPLARQLNSGSASPERFRECAVLSGHNAFNVERLEGCTVTE